MAKVQLTLAEQIVAAQAAVAAAQEKLDTLVAQEAIAGRLANVAPGYTVSYMLGRADTRRTVVGQVLFRGEVDGVDVVRALSGEGADVQVNQVKVADLLSAAEPVAIEFEDLPEAEALADAAADVLDDLLA